MLLSYLVLGWAMSENELVPHNSNLVKLSEQEIVEETRRLSGAGVDFENESHAKNTRLSYQKAWTRFEAWCFARGYTSLPASGELLKLYVTALTTDGVPGVDGSPGKPVGLQTVETHLAAITYAHEQVYPGVPSPVKDIPRPFMKGVRKKLAKPAVKKQWASRNLLREAFAGLPEKLPTKLLRDKALVLVAFDSGGRRRSEVAGMQKEHLKELPEGDILWVIPRTKTSDSGMSVVIPARPDEPETCAVTALKNWIAEAEVESGAVFRAVDKYGFVVGVDAVQPRVVAEAVKWAAERVGMNPDDFAGHSLRSGFVTDMHRAGVPTRDIQPFVGHKNIATTEGYKQVVEQTSTTNPVRVALKKL